MLEAARVDVIDEATDREPGEVGPRAHALDVRAERRLLVVGHEERQAPRVGAARCLDRGVFCSLEDLTTALQEWIILLGARSRCRSGIRTVSALGPTMTVGASRPATARPPE